MTLCGKFYKETLHNLSIAKCDYCNNIFMPSSKRKNNKIIDNFKKKYKK